MVFLISQTMAQEGDSGDCCIAHSSPGCEDPTCETSVCSYDPFWCQYDWDPICVWEAETDPNCDCAPTEACCLPDGSCQDLSAEDCASAGGTAQGPGTNCSTTECPQHTPVPTLNLWGMMVAAIVLGLIGFLRLWRRKNE